MTALAVEASKKALEMAEVDPGDVDLILLCTSTPEDLFGSAPQIQKALGCRSNPLSFDITAACSGFMLGLVSAACYIREDGLFAFDLHSDGEGQRHLNASLKENETDKKVGTNGSLIGFPPKSSNFSCIQMNGKEVFRFAVRVVPQSIEASLQKAGLTNSSIDWLLLHQANQRIIDAVATRLEIPSEHVISNLSNYGNTSAASIPLALDEAVRSGKVQAGHTIAAAGFGADVLVTSPASLFSHGLLISPFTALRSPFQAFGEGSLSLPVVPSLLAFRLWQCSRFLDGSPPARSSRVAVSARPSLPRVGRPVTRLFLSSLLSCDGLSFRRVRSRSSLFSLLPLVFHQPFGLDFFFCECKQSVLGWLNWSAFLSTHTCKWCTHENGCELKRSQVKVPSCDHQPVFLPLRTTAIGDRITLFMAELHAQQDSSHRKSSFCTVGLFYGQTYETLLAERGSLWVLAQSLSSADRARSFSHYTVDMLQRLLIVYNGIVSVVWKILSFVTVGNAVGPLLWSFSDLG
nr:3-oxoacyl-[acyl-carrier-protein] synthase 3 A, chloroplastic-like [Ipomoea batatas]